MRQISIILLLSSIYCLQSMGQTNDIVPTDGITSALHKAHTGRITFMQGFIPLEKYMETDFLTNFELKPSTDLNIRVFMDNSITNYLHVLAPALTPDVLIKKGNYQFSFYIDNNFIYKENLHYGAGLNKNTTTTFRVPLTTSTGADWWGVHLWERFMLAGGEKALTNGTHQLKIEIRPYLKMEENSEALVGNLIAHGELTLKIKPLLITAKQIAIQAIQPERGWVISKARYNKRKIEELNKAIAQNTFKEITSIVVIKEGKLLIEEYFNGAGRNTLHDTRSVGKSFSSALMGIAIKDGYIKDVDQSLHSFYNLHQYSNYSLEKDSITIKNLLTMSSAFNGSDQKDESPGNEENMYPTNNWVKFTLDLPMDSSKSNGKQWDYFTAGVVLLGDILHKSVPGGLEKYADKKLFQPLGIKTYQWQYTPQKVANTAGGLKMSSLSYAKVGELYKNDGVWNGKQILPTKWIEETFTKHFQLPGSSNEFYGYLFWNKTYTVNGKKYEAFYCAGNGGSKIFIFKNIPVTIVITAKAYNRAYGHPQVDSIMSEYILPSIID
ncbi:MAG: serine hydrolase domain-containing protein [Chitinophagaceae bacterium]